MKPCRECPEFECAISVRKMRESDRYTIENFVPSLELMRRAAHGIYSAAEWRGKRIGIICGSGNNGGDGYALAEILAENRIMPRIFRVSDKFSEDGGYYYRRAKALGVPDELMDHETDLSGFDILVDCILGTGFQGVPRGMSAEAIRKINGSGAFVISADINSGLDGDTGEAALAVRSDLTVSIGFYKTGMFLNDAPGLIRELVNADIGITQVE